MGRVLVDVAIICLAPGGSTFITLRTVMFRLGITLPLMMGCDCCDVGMADVIGDLMINAFLVPGAPIIVDLLIRICAKRT